MEKQIKKMVLSESGFLSLKIFIAYSAVFIGIVLVGVYRSSYDFVFGITVLGVLYIAHRGIKSIFKDDLNNTISGYVGTGNFIC